MGQPSRIAHQIGEEGKVRVRHKEFRSERKEARIGGAFDRGNIDLGVVDAEMIALDQ